MYQFASIFDHCMVVIELSLHLGFLGSISMATSSTEIIMLLKVVSISSSNSERDSNRFLTVQDKGKGGFCWGIPSSNCW